MQATRTRLELVRAHLTLGDTSAAKDLLIEAGQLLRGGCDFGSLQEDAGELSAAVPQPADSETGLETPSLSTRTRVGPLAPALGS